MDFSDLSDLTDFSSDEEFTPRSGAAKSKKNTDSGYVLKNALRPPRTVQYSAKYLYEQIIENHIDLNPEYQRDIVWPEAKQSGLIDSILRNYYIPPVIFSVSSQDDGTETRTCIDGKQRLTSIQRFFDGMICHKDSFTSHKLWYKGARGLSRKLLPQHYLNLFANKQIVCVEYENLTEDQEREMFQRVQLGVALTPAERLQAITGPFPTLIREIQAMITSNEGFDDNMEWASARGRDFQSIASVVYLIHKIPSQTFPGASTLDKWLQQQMPVNPTLRDAVLATFKKFISLVRNPKLNTPFTKPTRVSPIEFVMIGLLIFMLRTKSTDEEISQAIREMRRDVRSKHDDVRSNTKVTRTIFAFINTYVQKGSSGKPLASSQKKKRKRNDGSDEEPPRQKPSTSTPRNARATTSNAQPQTLKKTSTRGPLPSSTAASNTTPSSSKKATTTKPSASKTDSLVKESTTQGARPGTAATPSSTPTTSAALPSTKKDAGMAQSSSTPSRLKPQPPKLASTVSLPALNTTPSVPIMSTSSPVSDSKKEPETDIFAAIRQAKAKAANVKASIVASPVERVLPSGPPGTILESIPASSQPAISSVTQPMISDSHIPADKDSGAVAVARSQSSVPSAGPKGPANSTFGNILMLRTLSMASPIQTPMGPIPTLPGEGSSTTPTTAYLSPPHLAMLTSGQQHHTPPTQLPAPLQSQPSPPPFPPYPPQPVSGVPVGYNDTMRLHEQRTRDSGPDWKSRIG